MIYKLVEAKLRDDNFSFKLKFMRDKQIVNRVFEYNPCAESMCNQFCKLIGFRASENPKKMLERFKECIGSKFFVPVNGVLFNPYGGFKDWICKEFQSNHLLKKNIKSDVNHVRSVWVKANGRGN